MGFDHVVSTRVVVRVLGPSGDPAGAGFLLGPDVVATCAHVVADAVAADAYATDAPDRAVQVDFPMVGDDGPAVRTAVVVRWVPIAPDGSGDIAVLQLEGAAPPGARMPPLRRIEQLWGHPFRVLGFPDGLADGVWTTGRIRGRQATGWYQLQAAAGDQPVVEGFSGSPVWDEESGAVVGMTVAADASGTTSTAYLIPVDDVLGTDPELLPCPYRGLEPFAEEHAEFFFGRDGSVAQVEEVLTRQPLAVVAGPSGAGKSSLVRAGLLPRTRTGGAAVVELRPEPGRSAQELLDAAVPPTSAAEPTVVLVDQFEEFAAADPDGAQQLLAALGERLDGTACRADGSWPLQVVLTSRSATLDDVVDPDVAARLSAGTVLVPPMTRLQLRAAIAAPAERAPGLTFEPGLVDRILDDAAAEPGCLPLVESLLTELWERRDGGVLTIAAYERSGGVAGVVATRAEDVLAALPVPAEDAQLRRVFTALAGQDRDGRFVRRALPAADLDPALRPIVDQLVAGRLLVVERAADGQERLQLAHQALVEHWPRLSAWLSEDREFLAWRDEVGMLRDRWEAGDRDDGALLRGVALAATDSWLPRRAADVPTPLQEYVSRSRARQRREVRRWRMVTAVLAVLVLGAGALAAVAVARGDEVTRQLRLANAEVLGKTAQDRVREDPVTASALALTAHRLDPDNATARTALARLALGMLTVDAVFADLTDEPFLGLSETSTDGQVVLVRDPGEVVVVLGALGDAPTTWTLPGVPPDHRRLHLGADGRTVTVQDGEGRVLVWDLTARTGPVVVSDGVGPAVDGTLHYSPGDDRLAWLTPLPDGTRRLVVWDLRAGAPSRAGGTPISDPQIRAVSLTTDPGIVIEEANGYYIVRSLADGQVRARLTGERFAPGGTPFFITCIPGAVLVHDPLTGRELRRVPRLTEDCTTDRLGAELTGDGRFLVEQRSLVDSRDLDLWRITSLDTGQAYELLAPPRLDDADVQDDTPTKLGIAHADDHLVVYQPHGRSVLRLRADPADSLPAARLTSDRRYEVATRAGEGAAAATAVDAATRAVVGVLSDQDMADSGRRGFYVNNDDTLGVVTTAQDHHSYAEYTIPDFALLNLWTLPGPPRPGMRPGIDSEGDRVAAVNDGILVGWDRRTGQQVGAPIDLGADGRDTGRYGTSGARVVVRPGPGWEAAVQTPGRIELWDIPRGEQGVLPPGGRMMWVTFDPSGRLAAVDAQDRTTQVFDLASGDPVGPPIGAADAGPELGFLADGHLVSQARSDPSAGFRIVVHDPARGQRVAFTLHPGVEMDSELTSDGRLNIMGGDDGRRPVTFPLEAREWVAKLCGLTDRPFTATERALLPPGVDVDRPCEA